MNAKAVVLWFDGRTAEQRLVDAVPERRNASVLAIANVGQVERSAKIGCKRPQFGVSFDAGAEHRAVRATNLVAVLALFEKRFVY